MKKIATILLILIISISCGLFISYKNAKYKAELVAKSFSGNLSPFNTHLFLYTGNTGLPPCWNFRAEYNDVITGASFDVYVSLLGEIIEIPPKTKAPQ